MLISFYNQLGNIQPSNKVRNYIVYGIYKGGLEVHFELRGFVAEWSQSLLPPRFKTT